MAGTWEGLTLHAASVSPDLGLYMGRHLGENAAFYGKGIQYSQEALNLLEDIQTAKTDEEKLALEYEMQNLIYNADDGQMLFGCVMSVSLPQVFKHSWLKDDNCSIYHCNTWTLADCWVSK